MKASHKRVIFAAGILLVVWICSRLECRRSHRLRNKKYRRSSKFPCGDIPPTVYRRPDPLIYDQYFLMKQGLAVTWDNPDIHLERNGATVSSSSLDPTTEYDVIARIWNGSNLAPAIGMPVEFSYLDFGVGMKSVPIAHAKIDLPVNGAAGCPAFAHVKWLTPSMPGHYCLQVRLIWNDDANPSNNLGQENTDVKKLNSPHAAFTLPVANNTVFAQSLRLVVDAYEIPVVRDCGQAPKAETAQLSPEEVAEHRRDAVARHGRFGHPVLLPWQIDVHPAEIRLLAGAQGEITVDVTAPDGFLGRKGFNVNGFDGERLVGGVTLYVEGDGT
jgi:hypothetical protein